MIKEQDLRIGNWYWNGETKEYFEWCLIHFQRLSQNVIDIESLQGIEVESLLLNKIGFKQDFRYEYADGISYNDVFITTIQSDYVLEISCGDRVYSRTIQYLHELQNYYFFLTGQELNIQL